MSRILLLAAAAIALASCGSKVEPDKVVSPSDKGLDLPDVSKVQMPDAKIDARVMRTRSIAGTWTASMPPKSVRISFGNNGSVSVEQYVDRGGSQALVASASGKYGWRPDGIVTGNLDGTSGDLSPFASFRVSFTSSSRATVLGDGASIEITQASSGRSAR